MKVGTKRVTLIGAVLVASLLAGCNSIRGRVERGDLDYENYTAQHIFERGEYDLSRRNYDLAAQSFGEIERLYPYSELTKRAVIMQAYSHHLDKDYEASRSAAQRYIDFYPTDEDAAYAQYLLALSYYDQIDDIGRDQDFQTTSPTPEALHRLVEAYLSLGLVNEAQTAAAILGHNFRATDWYEDSYALLTRRGLRPEPAGDNWLRQVYRQMIKGEWL